MQIKSNKRFDEFGIHRFIMDYNPQTISKSTIIIHIWDYLIQIRWATKIPIVITIEMDKLKTHSPIYCIKVNWENGFNVRHPLERM